MPRIQGKRKAKAAKMSSADPLVLTMKHWPRFWSKVWKTANCWLWEGTLNEDGYGQFRIGGHFYSAHRVSFVSCGGVIPEGCECDHLCRVRACVRPSHIEAVSHRINCRRGNGGVNFRDKKFCPRGHEYSSNNTLIIRGQRRCRTCNNLKNKEYRLQKNRDPRNREIYLQKKRKYREKYKEALLHWQREYRKRNKEHISQKQREYREREGYLEWKRDYYLQHREEILRQTREYKEKHREHRLQQGREYYYRKKAEKQGELNG